MRLKIFQTDIVASTIDILQEMGGLALFVVTSLRSAFWNRNEWEKFFETLRHVENTFRIYRDQGRRNPTSIGAVTLFIVGNVCLFCLMVTVSYETGFPPLFIAIDILNYNLFLVVNMIYNTVVYINNKFEDMNDSFSHFEAMNYDLAGTIEKIKFLYMTLYRLVEIFNEIFGWPLVFIHFYWLMIWENYLLFFSRVLIFSEDSLHVILIAAIQVAVIMMVSI